MRSLQQYIFEEQLNSEYLLCEGFITKWLKKFWKWMTADIKKNTNDNDGIYFADFDIEEPIKVSKFSNEYILTLIDMTESSNKKGSFYSLYTFVQKNSDIAKKLTYFGFLQDKKVIAIYGGMLDKDKKNFTISIQSINNTLIKQKENIANKCDKALFKLFKEKTTLQYSNKYNGIIISEAIDVDNLNWKMETWFSRDEHQKEMFNKIYADNEQLDNELSNGFDMEGFVNFIYDDISPDSDKDYKYQFEQIVKYLKQK